jgi:hypothetical protein
VNRGVPASAVHGSLAIPRISNVGHESIQFQRPLDPAFNVNANARMRILTRIIALACSDSNALNRSRHLAVMK